MSWWRKERCKRCKRLPEMRFCMRTTKQICRDCCNELRCDQKCPEACAYHLKPGEFGSQFAAKIDSATEYVDLLKRVLIHWGNRPAELFDQRVPSKMAETPDGQRELRDFFSHLTLPPGFPTRWLSERWNLGKLPEPQPLDTPETFALEFAHAIEEDDWERAAACYGRPEAGDWYRASLENDKRLRRGEQFVVISSGLNEDRSAGFVHFDVSQHDPLTLVLRCIDSSWRLIQRINGAPEMIASEKELWKPVAVLLSQNKLGDAHELLVKQQKYYPDSPDTYYYLGLYEYLSNHAKPAVERFREAVLIDPDFTEARYNLATLLQLQGELEIAEKEYRTILTTDPQEYRSLNNLASICIDSQRPDEARQLLNRCLAVKPDFEVAQKNLARL